MVSARLWKTRSILFPLIIVNSDPAPLIVRGLVISKSPNAASFSFVPKIESVNVPDGIVISSGVSDVLAS